MVLSELPDGSVWLGRADDYSDLVLGYLGASRVRPSGVVLQAALKMIGCALIGSTKGKR